MPPKVPKDAALHHPYLAAEFPYKTSSTIPGRLSYTSGHPPPSSSNTSSNFPSPHASSHTQQPHPHPNSIPNSYSNAHTYAYSQSNPRSHPPLRIKALGSDDLRAYAPSPTGTAFSSATHASSRTSNSNRNNNGSNDNDSSSATQSSTVATSSSGTSVSAFAASSGAPSTSRTSLSPQAQYAAYAPNTCSISPTRDNRSGSTSRSPSRRPSFFVSLMKNASASGALPVPGQAYFDARRELWLTSPPYPLPPSSPTPSRVKLEALLNQPGAVESEEVWKAGLKNVWKGLVGGNQLRKNLPLSIVLKILQAGWLRDGTWPDGAPLPAWDDQLQSQEQGPGGHNAPMQGGGREGRGENIHALGQGAGPPSHRSHGMPAMMVYTGNIPPGYSASSGDQPEQTYYSQPYQYSQPTPPPEDPEQIEEGDVDDEGEGEEGEEEGEDDGRHEGG